MKTHSDTTIFNRESDLITPVARFFKNREFHMQSSEVPFYEYRIDMYLYSKRQDISVAVELKLTKWSRALEQAVLYQLCSDLVYIAMPCETIKRVGVDALGKYGIGLVAVGINRCREVIIPRRSNVIRQHYRRDYLNMLSPEGNQRWPMTVQKYF
jgi:hypothetical protein